MRPLSLLVALGAVASVCLLACQPAASLGPVGGSVLTASPAERAADGNAVIEVQLAARDGNGLILPNVAVTFAVSPSGPVLSSPVALTDADGLAHVALTSEVAGNFVVTAELLVGGSYLSLPGSAAVQFTTGVAPQPTIQGAPASANSTLQVLGSSVAGAPGGLQLAVTLRDRTGVPLPNTTVTLTSSVASDAIAPAAIKTTSYGMATFTLSATAAGKHTLTASGAGLTLTRSVTITATDPNATMSTLSLTPNSQLLGNGNVTGTLGVFLADMYGNPVAGQSVVLSCTPSCFASPNMILTNAAGMAQAGAGAMGGGPMTYTASAGAVSLVLVQNYLQPLVSSVALSPNSLPAAVGAQSQALLQAATPLGYPLASAPFVLSSPSLDVAFAPRTGVTDPNGQMGAGLSINLSGNHLVLAKIGGNQLVSTTLLSSPGTNTCAQASYLLPLAPSIVLDGRAVPYAVVAADFTGDGAQDLAVTDTSSPPRLWVLRNNGSDGFASAQNYALSGNAHGLAAGVLASSGGADLVVTQSDGNSVQVWLNQGGGAFALGPVLPVGGAPEAVVVADFDQDGNNDIAVANSRDDASGNSLTVWFNDGNAVFTTSVTVPVGSAPIALAAARIDSDAWPDLAVAHGHNDTFAIVRGQSGRTFLPPQYYAVSGNATGLALGDLNNDGTADVAVTSDVAPFVHTYASDANGLLTPLGSYAVNTTFVPSVPRGVQIFDVNADGALDLVVADHGLRVWLGNNSGQLAPSLHYGGLGSAPSLAAFDASVGAPSTRTVIVPSAVGQELFAYQHLEAGSVALAAVSTGAVAQDFAAADVTGDGLSDLVVPDFASTSIKLLAATGNQAGGNFVPRTSLSASGNVSAVAVGDYTGDARADIAAVNATQPGLDIFVNTGNGVFAPAKNMALPSAAAAIAAADVTGDGLSDLLLLPRGGNQLVVLRATGGGNFAAATSYAAAANAALVVTGDLNADGLLDVVVAGTSGDANVYAFVNQGNGTLAPALLTTLPSAPRALALADIDGDGMLDVVAVLPGSVSWWQGRGNGSFGAGQSLAAASTLGGQSVGLLVTDVTGDSTPDIVWASGGVLGVASNDGAGHVTLHPDSFVLAGSHMTLRLASFVSNGVLVPLFVSDETPAVLSLPFLGCPG